MKDNIGNSPPRTFLSRVFLLSGAFGFHPARLGRALVGFPRFISNCMTYYNQRAPGDLALSVRSLYPILDESHVAAGSTLGHYFHQDLWAARKIFARKPPRHVDIGSRIDGFIAHLLVFTKVEMVDIRPLKSTIPGLTFVQDDATQLSVYTSGSIDSLSSLHAAEHFGLGRYGDPIDPQGHLKFMSSLQRVLAEGGRLYFSVPIGRQRLEFNAHRVLNVETVLAQYNRLRLVSVSFVDDDGDLHEEVSPGQIPGNMEYGCGLFEFTK